MRSAASLLTAFLVFPGVVFGASGGAVIDFSQVRAGSTPSAAAAAPVSGTATAVPSATPRPAASATPQASAPVLELSAREREAYRQAERAGGILDEEDGPSDGKVEAGPRGSLLLSLGQEVHLLLNEGVSSGVGEEFVAVREAEQVHDPATHGLAGTLMMNLAVLRVTAADGPRLKARVVKSYQAVEPGDKIRSRKRELALFARGLVSKEKAPGGLAGSVLEVQGAMLAGAGGVVYLDLGRNQGLHPGTRLSGPDGSRLQVLSVRAKTSAARVLSTKDPLQRGARVHVK